MTEVDVCILGAGPGGAATALQLDALGIPSLLLDQATFPRDKVCGDALSGKAVAILNRLNPNLVERLEANSSLQVDSWGIRFIAPNRYPIVVPFSPKFDREKDPAPGYISKRVHFDNFLVEEVRTRAGIDFREGVRIDAHRREGNRWILSDTRSGLDVSARLVIVASGAQSAFARDVTGYRIEDRQYAVAVRGYYQGVTGLDENNFIELHFLKEIAPGYLWIFPLPDGQANVGLGMLKSMVNKQGVNLKQQLRGLIADHPDLRERFAGAEIVGDIRGFGLPLGTRKRSLSGDQYMLVGDAGALIDPFTGEGIGNAMLSGTLAARRAQEALQSGDTSAAFLKAYDASVYRATWAELRLSRKLQQLAQYPSLFNLFAFFARRNSRLAETMSAMFLDVDLRQKLLNPIFLSRLLFSRG